MIIKIKNENVAVRVKKYEYENVDNEIILYQSDTEKILVMNETASFIWLYLCDLSSHDSNISDFDIMYIAVIFFPHTAVGLTWIQIIF